MPKEISKKIYSILEDIEELGSQEPTRLVVLKKWFQVSSRLKSFGIFIAKKASGSDRGRGEEEEQLFTFGKKLLHGVDVYNPSMDKRRATQLCSKLVEFQKEQKKTRWGVVRTIKNWNLFLIEQGLQLFLDDFVDARAGYKLASDYCKNYDPRYGATLNGRSIGKLKDVIHFMLTVESSERSKIKTRSPVSVVKNRRSLSRF